MTDTRKLILSRGIYTPSENVDVKWTDLAHSLGLACILGVMLEEKGLGRVGVSVVFKDAMPYTVFTSVGFGPTVESKIFARGSGEGIFIGAEGVSEYDHWPMKEYGKDGNYQPTWTKVDRNNEAWKKLKKFFPEGQWHSEAKKVAESLLIEHADHIKKYWVPFVG